MTQRSANAARERRQLISLEPYLWLFELQVNDAGDAFRLVNFHDPVLFEGREFSPAAIHVERIDSDNEGTLPAIELTLSDATGEVSAQLVANGGFINQPVNIWLVHRDHLDDPTDALRWKMFVLTPQASPKGAAVIRLGQHSLQDYPHPRHRFLRERCRWVYKSKQCGYDGALPTCDKTLSEADGCTVHDNAPRFGGFPGIPKR